MQTAVGNVNTTLTSALSQASFDADRYARARALYSPQTTQQNALELEAVHCLMSDIRAELESIEHENDDTTGIPSHSGLEFNLGQLMNVV